MARLNAIVVLDCKDGSDPESIHIDVFTNDIEGTREAQDTFRELVKGAMDPEHPLSEARLEKVVAEGVFEVGEGYISIAGVHQ